MKYIFIVALEFVVIFIGVATTIALKTPEQTWYVFWR